MDTSAALRGYGRIHITSSQEKRLPGLAAGSDSSANASTRDRQVPGRSESIARVVTGTLDCQRQELPERERSRRPRLYRLCSGQDRALCLRPPAEAALKSWLASAPEAGLAWSRT